MSTDPVQSCLMWCVSTRMYICMHFLASNCLWSHVPFRGDAKRCINCTLLIVIREITYVPAEPSGPCDGARWIVLGLIHSVESGEQVCVCVCLCWAGSDLMLAQMSSVDVRLEFNTPNPSAWSLPQLLIRVCLLTIYELICSRVRMCCLGLWGTWILIK